MPKGRKKPKKPAWNPGGRQEPLPKKKVKHKKQRKPRAESQPQTGKKITSDEYFIYRNWVMTKKYDRDKASE